MIIRPITAAIRRTLRASPASGVVADAGDDVVQHEGERVIAAGPGGRTGADVKRA